jgi:hypothetical protein
VVTLQEVPPATVTDGRGLLRALDDIGEEDRGGLERHARLNAFEGA